MAQVFDKIFISDTHLSSLRCQSDELNYLLDSYDCDALYLLGDIVDLWNLKGIEYWPPIHSVIIRKIIDRIIRIKTNYIVGNHDDFLSKLQFNIKNLNVCEEDSIEINGKRLLVIHGHQFDLAIKYFRFIAVLGTIGYSLLLHLNRLKRKFIKKPYSLSKNVDKKLGAVLGNFEKAILKYAKMKKFDGVICGHTHKPDLKVIDGLIYANAGDFVKHSSFITQKDNQLQLKQITDGTLKTVKILAI
jgi:UDP-2,3-diacylglucosamine pyrophosphatase LpxH